MRVREVAALAMLTACGINPAYDEASSTPAPPQSTSTSDATTDVPAPTTTGSTSTSGTTGGLEATGDASSSTAAPSSDASTSTSTSDESTSAATTGSPAGDCPAEDPSLIACYAFEEDPRTGEMLDGSMHGFNGSRAGTGAAASVDGFGAAVDLDPGSDVHVIHHPEFTPAKLTIAAFFYIDQQQSNRGLIDRDDAYGLFLTDGRIQCRIKTDLATQQIEVDIDVSRWYHFACTYDGQRMMLHGHGLQFNPSPTEAPLAGEVNKSISEFVIGRDSGNDETKLQGAMDQVMLYDRPLGPLEICALAGPLCSG